MFTEFDILYEEKCLRCDGIEEFITQPRDEDSYDRYYDRLVSESSLPKQQYCKGCDKLTIHQTVSVNKASDIKEWALKIKTLE